MCDVVSADQAAFVRHLADVHELIDDEGARPWEPPEVAAPTPAPTPLPLTLLPSPPPLAAPPASGERTVPVRLVAVIVAGVLVVAAVAMVMTRSPSAPASTSVAAASVSSEQARVTTTTTTPSPPLVLASTTSATDSVDPAEAQTVAIELWTGMTQALNARDADALGVFEDGPLLQSDIGMICQVGCPPPTFSPKTSVTVNVPHQTTWPATFLATITYATGCHAADPPCVNQFVAVQPAKDQPWKATLLINYGGSTFSEHPTLLADGFAATAPDAGSVTPALLADYANYLSAVKDTGQKPASTVLDDGPFTSDEAGSLFDPPGRQAARGLSEPTTYGVDSTDPIYTFTDDQGGTTACGVVRYSSVMTSTNGSPLPAAASVSEWGMRVPGGLYSSLTLSGLHMVCFERPPRDSPIEVIASWGGNVAVTGAPA